jgi:polysaccharide biosynthesis/export protein
MPKALSVAFGLLVIALGGAARADDGYLLQPGDLLAISVWKEPDLTQELLVRPDGAISMPLVGDVEASGHTTEQIRAAIDARLRAKYIPDPVVTVSVKMASGNQVYVLGKVNRPGPYPMSRPIDVLQVISLAGGATPFANLNAIRILRRQDGREVALHFRYKDVLHGRHLDQNIQLQGGDTVVVP